MPGGGHFYDRTEGRPKRALSENTTELGEIGRGRPHLAMARRRPISHTRYDFWPSAAPPPPAASTAASSSAATQAAATSPPSLPTPPETRTIRTDEASRGGLGPGLGPGPDERRGGYSGGRRPRDLSALPVVDEIHSRLRQNRVYVTTDAGTVLSLSAGASLDEALYELERVLKPRKASRTELIHL